MKPKTAFAIIAACIGFVAALEEPAYSATAVWQRTSHWTVYGNTETRQCVAETVYERERKKIMIVLDAAKDSAALAISGVRSEYGAEYTAFVAGSNGANGRITATGLGDGTVVIPDLNETAVRSLANSRSIFIEGLGRFRLTGSKEAMRLAWECSSELNSY